MNFTLCFRICAAADLARHAWNVSASCAAFPGTIASGINRTAPVPQLQSGSHPRTSPRSTAPLRKSRGQRTFYTRIVQHQTKPPETATRPDLDDRRRLRGETNR